MGNLQRRFTIIFVVLTIVPLLVLSGFIGSVSSQNLRQQSQARLVTVVRVTSSEIEAFITARVEELSLLVSVTGLPEETRFDLLQNFLSFTDVYDIVALTDPAGQEILRFSRPGVLSEFNMANRANLPEYTTLRDGADFYYGEVAFKQDLFEPVMTMSVPIRNAQTGALDGILVADFRFSTVWQFLADLNLDSGITVFIVDPRTNTIVGHPDPSVVLRGTRFAVESPTAPVQEMTESELWATEAIQLGNESFVVVAQQPIEPLFTLLNQLNVLTRNITLVVLVLATLIVWLVVRQVVRPIRSLSYVAQQIEKGDLSLRAKIQNRDEIGDLAQSFNNMTNQLRDLIDTLENRVEARTRDLAVVSGVSKQVATVLVLDDLLPLIVQRTRESFNFYHVSIYVVEPDSDYLILAASTGEHTLPETLRVHRMSRGLAATAARQGEPLVVNDVFQSLDFLPNPYLPDIRSELVVPMIVGDQLIGVLDLQSDARDTFTDDNLQLMQSLAEQLAMAVQNARLYAQQVQIADELRSLDNMKSQFLASMSHELRTPLNAILNFTQFVKSGKLGDVNDRQVDALGKAIKGGEHLLSLINDVLDVAKIEAGMMQLFIEADVKLKEELEQVLSTAAVLLKDKPVGMTVMMPEEMPLVVGDRRRLRQVMLNLVSNACKYTDEGIVGVKLELVDDMVVFTVEDTGVGIAPENFDMIFEAFQQTPQGLRNNGGTGLGLAISRSLAEAHHGSLTFTSEVGKGTIFVLRLPIRSSELLEQVF